MKVFSKILFFLIIVFLIPTIIYSQNPCAGISTITYANKTYNTVQIGNQCWLKENLDYGTMLNGILNQTDNEIIEKYCYDDDPNNCLTYGGLYQWNEAMAYSTKEGSKGICPIGWHIPTKEECQTLVTSVNNNGNALKALGQGEATNTSGFSALLSGSRDRPNGGFYGLRGTYNALFVMWSSTEYYDRPYYLDIRDSTNYIFINYYYVDSGSSIRCLKDNITSVQDYQNGDKNLNEYSLSQNYPNPFNPATSINYTVSLSNYVTIKIYDLLGNEVATLVNEYKPVGNYNVIFKANNLGSGIYYYRLKVGNYSETKKLVMVK